MKRWTSIISNLSIGSKLWLGLGVPGVLAAVIGLTGVVSLRYMHGALSSTVDVQVPAMNALTDMQTDMATALAAERSLLFMKQNTPPADAQAKLHAGSVAEVESEWRSYQKVPANAGEEALRAQLSKALPEWVKLSRDVIASVAQDSADGRLDAIDTSTGPAAEAYGKVHDALEKITVARHADVAARAKSATTTAALSTWLVLLLTVAGGALGAATAFVLRRAITVPLRAMTAAAREISGGNVDQEVTFRSSDEVGQLADSFRGTIDYLKDLAAAAGAVAKGDLAAHLEPRSDHDALTLNMQRVVATLAAMSTETDRLAGAAVAGQLAARGDAARFEGGFRAIVEGMNRTLDAVIEPLHVAARYVDRIAHGDIPARITDPYQGDFNTIKNNLNTCIGAVEALVADARMLAGAAVEGRLRTRADATRHHGEFRSIVQGVNDTLDAVIGPLEVAAEYVDRIAHGNIPEPITDEYRGDFNAIKVNLNTCIAAVNRLIADAGLLADAAVEGRLDVRADATRHAGDFRRIVEGVNKATARFVALLDDMPAPALIIDREMTVRYINKSGAAIGQTTPQQVIGTKCFDYFKTTDCKTDRCACARAMKTGATASSETIARPLPGATYEIAYNGVPLTGNDGQVIGAFEVVDDQTAVRAAARVTTKVADFQASESAKVVEALGLLARGDAGVRLETASADADTRHSKETFDAIAGALNRCAQSVGALVDDAQSLSQAAVAGQLKTRADVSRHEGDFRRIVQGVNETLDAVVGPLGVAAQYLDRISRGDVPAPIAEEYRGDFDAIKQSLNRSIGAIGTLVADTGALVEAAVAGQLQTRADLTRHQGDFRRIVQGVNETLDAVIGPIDEAARTLESVARRDLSVRAHGEYRGDHARIKEALNTAINNLDEGLSAVAAAADQVASASEQIASASQSMAHGASTQASSLEEMTASLQEMSSMTRQNAENAQKARAIGDGALRSATEGLARMGRLSESIEKIKTSSDQTAKIVKTIDEIAFQTNLLALNAAVEAARAGDAGKGFAVVAEEVRNLAMRSAEAARNTADLIEEAVRNAEQGVQVNDDVRRSLDEINTQARRVSEVMGEIAAASEQQSIGISQVNIGVEQMNQMTQSSAASSEESASIAEELAGQAEEVRSLVRSFSLSR